jgi:hypothetical protein
MGGRMKRDHGANDFTIFRKKPLIAEGFGILPTDVLFVTEKFESGPYWRVSDSDRGIGDRLRRFWGGVFEAYVNDQLATAAARSGTLFFSDPRWGDDPSAQVCDGILIEGDVVVLLEYKASMFTARAKYSGRYKTLRDEIITKLIRNEDRKKKKGVEQLAYAVKRLSGNDASAAAVKGVDLSRMQRLYPLLVTLDDLGGSLLMSRFLQGYFKKFLGHDSHGTNKTQPLLCTNVESLEQVLPYLDIYPLSGFLQHWLNVDPNLMATLLAHLPDGLPARRNDLLYQEWQRLSEQFEVRLFPDEQRSRRV